MVFNKFGFFFVEKSRGDAFIALFREHERGFGSSMYILYAI